MNDFEKEKDDQQEVVIDGIEYGTTIIGTMDVPTENAYFEQQGKLDEQITFSFGVPYDLLGKHDTSEETNKLTTKVLK